MQIRVGYDFRFSFPEPAPMIVTLSVHHSRVSDLIRPDPMHTSPSIPIQSYRDGFGNWCNRITAPAGPLRIWADALVNDTGMPDEVSLSAEQHAVAALPEESLVFLLGSR